MESVNRPADDNWEYRFTFLAAIGRAIRRLRRRVKWYHAMGCGLVVGIVAGLVFAGWLIAVG